MFIKPTPIKPRYRVDFARQMSECDFNYVQLMKLLPELPTQDVWCFDIDVGSSRWQVGVQICDRAKYTTTVMVTQADNLGSWSEPLRLLVRMYHDAGTAEVLSWHDHSRLQVRYSYPNKAMYQNDEKAQFNRFLGEWLTYCLKYGQARVDLTGFVFGGSIENDK